MPARLKEFAAENRENPTDAESLLWRRLGATQIGVPFWREHAVRYARGSFRKDCIIDFFCPQAMLGVEVDGPIHRSRRGYDHDREQDLAKLGIALIRFTNWQVFNHLDAVVQAIAVACRQRLR